MNKKDNVDSLRERMSSIWEVKKYSSIFTLISGGTFDRYLGGNLTLKKVVKMQKNQGLFLYIHDIDS